MQAEDARLLGEFGVMKKMYTQLQHLNRYDQLAHAPARCWIHNLNSESLASTLAKTAQI